jgi:hypothetical protein
MSIKTVEVELFVFHIAAFHYPAPSCPSILETGANMTEEGWVHLIPR